MVRSDFYQLTPTGGMRCAGTWLGYFELSTNGAMTYVAYPSTTPVIASINRSGSLTTITYTDRLYGTYTLRGTNNLTSGTPMANWPPIATLTSGDTATHTITGYNHGQCQILYHHRPITNPSKPTITFYQTISTK